MVWYSLRNLSATLLCLVYTTGVMAEPLVYTEQGRKWTSAKRDQYYTQDQGSRIMPLKWMQALREPRRQVGFLADGLDRYGYLNNENGNLPVGFTVANDDSGAAVIGMTCSACHTREITVQGTAYRIDGGPAISDFQSFLADLDSSVNEVLTSARIFRSFANEVLGPDASAIARQELRIEVESWHLPYHALVNNSLPTPAWGPSRLDAVAMIFNRLTGLDIGVAPPYIIEENIRVANAPVRYPFLWNAGKQNKTQWPGFAENGNSLLGLARNLGEVYGVFAEFKPKKDAASLLGMNYLEGNSANFAGLGKLEDLMNDLGPPAWPWSVDRKLAREGKKIYSRGKAQGGCKDCHGVKRTGFLWRLWDTPVLDDGTDVSECNLLVRDAKSGVMEGAEIPVLKGPLQKTDSAFNILGMAVAGSILQEKLHYGQKESLLFTEVDKVAHSRAGRVIGKVGEDLISAFDKDVIDRIRSKNASDGGCAYESRVLKGIWAAAPYLHNGSVPTLADLLEKPGDRPVSFAVGPEYDLERVGLARTQTKFDYVLETTDCSDLTSGNSRCGHTWGTNLTPAQKTALLEYLKIL